ncbi:MAG: methanogenesis marker 14 protein [Candidatus Thorarchaeota archaeon]
MSTASLRRGPFYTVASVELGNSTTKCVIVSTDLKTGQMYEIYKEVRLTRDVRPPREGEKVFGTTLVGIPLTRESVTELVRDTLLSAVQKARLNLERDIHFVVRSTGVTAGFATPAEVGEMVKALAEGCLAAGVPPRKMTASMSPDNLPPGIRNFTWLKKVYFDGAVAGSLPPSSTEIVANEMEGELVTAGIKGAARSAGVDFRNPVMTLDFGTTLAGRITDDSLPYSKTIGSFAGLAGAIPDALVRGAGLVDPVTGIVLDVPPQKTHHLSGSEYSWVDEIEQVLRIQRVPAGTHRFGTVPVDTGAAQESDVILIGADAGVNGNGLKSLERIGAVIRAEGGVPLLMSVIDAVQARVVERLVACAEEEDLLSPHTSLGLTGRAITTGRKPRLLKNELRSVDGSLWTEKRDLVVVEDGLAMGAGVAARCMNSLGTPKNPLGGRKGDSCIMALRMKHQRRVPDHGDT